MMTKDQMIIKIADLEIQLAALESGNSKDSRYGNNFPKALKLIRKMQKLRNKL